MTDDLSGRTLSQKFTLQRRIGVGGMATVYEAINNQIDKRVAIKVLKREYFAQKTLMARFQREARHAAKMDHPHMVQITDYDVDGDIPYIVMEYLEGSTLSDLQHSLDGPLPWRRVVDMCAQVCSALHYAHCQGLLHRDIKPSNVFLLANPGGEGDRVKLLDFGIAKLQEPDRNEANPLTSPSQVPGTPEYMAPEQAKGEECEARTDIYSLGVMMYRLLTGRLPFYGATHTETVMQHVLRPPTPPSALVPAIEIPPALEAILLKTLAKLPEQRWDTATILRDALLELLDDSDESTQIHRPRRPPSANRPSLHLSAPAWDISAFEWRDRLLARRRIAAAFSGVSLGLCAFMFLSLFPMPGVATIAGVPKPPPEERLPRTPGPPPPPPLMADPPRRPAPTLAPPTTPPLEDDIILDDTLAAAPATPPPANTPSVPTPPADAPSAPPPVTPTPADAPSVPPPVTPAPADAPPRVRPPLTPRRQIEIHLKKSRNAFKKCSEKLPLGLGDTIYVDLSLEPSTGRALDVSVDEAHRTMSYATCASTVLRGMKFPRVVGDGQFKALPLELKP